jgi:rhamnose transport system ATP-binding protein
MFDELSVAENIFIGRHLQRGPFIDWPAMNAQATRVLEQIGARFGATALVKNLSLAERHLVEIARALSQKASVVILDEPTAALSQQEIRDFYGLVRTLRDQGVGVIFITHKFDEVFAVADRYLVLRDGASVGRGHIAEASEAELVRLMAGRAIEQIYPPVASEPGEVLMQVRWPVAPDRVRRPVVQPAPRRDPRLLWPRGLGPQRSHARADGAEPRGPRRIRGRRPALPAAKPGRCDRRRRRYVPEERQRQGGILSFSVQHNISLAGLSRFARGPWLSKLRESELCARMTERLRIKTGSPDTPMSGLSGGNQQKMVIAKWLGLNPRIVILDEPTKGIDVGAKQAVYQLIAEMVSQGLAVILVSSELPEVMNLAHRVIVMRRGRQVAEFARGSADAEAVVAAASGIAAPVNLERIERPAPAFRELAA